MNNNINCIILCAGSGSRMNDNSKNKVCFEIAGKPAVVRLSECGINKFIAVVGNKSESVMNVLSGEKGVTFAYQKEQSGTGNAAMCGLNVINDFEIDGPVLVVMGDKLIDKSVFKMLVEDFYSKKTDISMITQPSDFNKSGGKIVVDDGKIVGIVEHMDTLLLKVFEMKREGLNIEEIYNNLNLTEKQKSKIESKLDVISDDFKIEINGKAYTSSEILSSGMVNCATYLYSRDAINSSICNLNSDNAQNEIYFTDTVKLIAEKGLVSCVKVSDKNLIQTFNTMEELDAINNSFKSRGEHH